MNASCFSSSCLDCPSSSPSSWWQQFPLFFNPEKNPFSSIFVGTPAVTRATPSSEVSSPTALRGPLSELTEFHFVPSALGAVTVPSVIYFGYLSAIYLFILSGLSHLSNQSLKLNLLKYKVVYFLIYQALSDAFIAPKKSF